MRRSLLAALLLATAACGRERSGSDTFTWHSSLAPGRTIQVRNLNGPIEVEHGDGEQVEVTAVKRYKGFRPQEVRFVTGTDADGAVICAVWGRSGDCDRQSYRSRNSLWTRLLGGRGEVSVAFTVRVPPGVGVDVGTTNGAVTIAGVDGPVQARTVNGKVEATARGGPLSVETVNGSIIAIVDSLGAADPVTLRTVNGSVTAELPAGIAATLDLGTVNGRVEADFPVTLTGSVSPKRLRGTVGGGGREIKLETVNGGVTLKRRGAATTE